MIAIDATDNHVTVPDCVPALVALTPPPNANPIRIRQKEKRCHRQWDFNGILNRVLTESTVWTTACATRCCGFACFEERVLVRFCRYVCLHPSPFSRQRHGLSLGTADRPVVAECPGQLRFFMCAIKGYNVSTP
jgi:hypothetical protein